MFRRIYTNKTEAIYSYLCRPNKSFMKNIFSKLFIAFLSIALSFNAKANIDTVTVQDFQFTPSNLAICLGDTLRFVWVSGFHDVHITSPVDSTSNDMQQSGDVFEYTPTAAGSYIFQCDYHSMMTGMFTVTAAPAVNFGADITACGSTLLNAGSPGSNYLWSTGSTAQTIIVSSSGTYSVSASNMCGADADTIMVAINPNPVVNLGPDSTQCGGSILLDAGTGAAYLWSTAASTQTISVSSSGNYFVKVTDANGCFGYDTVMAAIQSLPVVNLGSDTAVCAGITLDAGNNPGCTFLWNSGDQTQTIVASSSDTFYVDVTNTCGTVSDTVMVTILPNPVLNVIGPPIICAGDTAILCASGCSSYSWSTGSSSSCVAVVGGNYSVVCTDVNGCTASASVTVTMSVPPTVSVNPTNASCGTCNDGAAAANVSGGSAPYAFLWSTSPAQNTQTATGLMTGNYTVCVTDANGCSACSGVFIGPVCDTLPTPFTGGNRQDGNMFDVQAVNNITVTGFDGNASTGNGNMGVEIYYKAGTHVGSETNAGAWTLIGTDTVIPNAVGMPTPIPIPVNVTIPAGQTYAFYITISTTAAVDNFEYNNGTAFGSPVSQNADLKILEGVGKAYPFGTTYPTTGPPASRVWNGIIHYCVNAVVSVEEEMKAANVKVFPNPMSTNASVQIIGAVDNHIEMSLFDVFGKEVKNFSIDSSSFTFNRNGLSSGIYFYSIKNKSGIIGLGKIIIQ